ncbi:MULTISPECIES: MotA/TolQ/ExbB proton channel family protein [unclassified Campylobacter]|uniref:MotA/TolQ/ExbB proton channel family protein n=1 Tax=unclassified Campylobacter TaxID=2593542 RepID=UPI0012383A5E|nr:MULTISPECIES: MotA/TolQ/ExbB proton channel family protein [unclassified Campylobacter]KAA6227315.1 MotA/TolQ/ExbB proton channel family protein [Campylobacter sp. LR286c]KAA6227810.1 MotA/TolQ/ExbB proton channel family protein [Campylobacter sp. LR185c]KAA6228218.1 MotA/TolQ/ExbB proton channel family protein [Campylobacter sp. LR196d]KAA6229218.1 MotA/TolQ/ExbB proton channel family protein [Campylobacter sp. LR291e]KAA6231023.1 MotA/TolQ/ExbB proton channel family protein [Campylobacter
MNIEAAFHFFNSSSLITYIVLAWLSFYFIISFAILFARSTYLAAWRLREKQSLESLLLGQKDISKTRSILRKSTDSNPLHLEIYKNLAQRRATGGLTWLSIIASTSPFIGLFGTVISILETFGGLGTQNSLSIIAPKISEALVATGCGILVAIPAYTFHLIIKRKAYELISVIDSEIKVISSKA